MKSIKRGIAAAAACLMLSSAPAFAFTPGDAVFGENGQLMANVGVFAGSGEYGDAVEQAGSLDVRFRNPLNVLAMPDGSYLVSDTENHVIVQLKDGQASVYAGFRLLDKDEAGVPLGTLLDGARNTAVFHQPAGLARDADGNVYVADSANHAIRKIDPQGNVTTIAGNGVLGLADGQGAEARFNRPMGVIAAEDGSLYVADTGNHVIRKIDRNGNVTTLNAASERVVEIVSGVVEDTGDYRDGPLREALFNEPYALVRDAKGNLYVSDSGNSLIRHIDLAAGEVTTVAGKVREPFYEENAPYAIGEYADGPADAAAFHAPKGMSLNEDGSLLIADSLNHTIRLLKDGIVSTAAGSTLAEQGEVDGIDGENALYNPTDIAQTADGFLIVDTYNQRIRQLLPYRLPATVKADGAVDVILNERHLNLSHHVTVQDGRTMVSASELAGALGLEAEVAADAASVTIMNGMQYRFAAGRPFMDTVDEAGNGAQVALDVVPYAADGDVYVPVRFLAEALDLDVEWHAATESVILRTK